MKGTEIRTTVLNCHVREVGPTEGESRPVLSRVSRIRCDNVRNVIQFVGGRAACRRCIGGGVQVAQKMIWTLTAWQVEGSYSELVLEGLKTTLFCEPDMQSANESVSPLRARKGWPVPWPAGSVSACGSSARREGREEGASAAEEGAKTGEKTLRGAFAR